MEKEDYKTLKKRRKQGLIAASILVILFVFVPIGAICYYKGEKSGMDGETKVVDIIENEHRSHNEPYDLIYSPEFKYVVDGKEYSCKTKLHTSRKPESDTIVYYKTDDPSKCITSYELTNYDVFYVIIGFGVLIAIISSFSMWRITKKMNEL